MKSFAIALVALNLCATFPARADYSTEQVEMAATGRYDLLEKSLEARAASHPFSTADQHALCFAYSKTKRYSQLLSCLNQLEDKIRKGDKRTRLFGLSDATPTVYIMRAEALIELGQYAGARAESAKAVKWLHDDDSDDLDMVANALAAQSLAHSLDSDEEGGKKIEKQLAAIPLGTFSDYANAKAFAIARARMGLKDYRGVIDILRSDKSFAVHVFLDRLVSGSFLTGTNNWAWAELPRAFMLNKALLETGQIQEAKSGFERLLSIPQVSHNGDIFWLLLNELGNISAADNHLAEAIQYYQQAIEVIETQRASINTEASKIGFVGDKQGVYASSIDLARRLNRPEMLVELIERSKSRALVDLLASRDTQSPLTARTKEAQSLLNGFRQAQETAALQLPVDMGKADAGGGRAVVSGKADELKRRAPELASLVTVSSMPADEIQKLIQPDEVLLEYFGFGNTLFAVAMSGKESMMLRIDAKQLESEIRGFREEIQQLAKYPSLLASSLYHQLIQPFEPLIGNRNLLIVPHGALHYLPFAALHDGKSNLIAKRDLRFLPSSSVQKYIRPHHNQPLEKVLIFGNPDLGQAALDLPSAEDEARAIAGIVSGSQIFTRKQATETAFKKLAYNHNYVHIASHGQFKSDNALDSRLLLTGDAENDGSLTVRELYDTPLNAELVTLSACETGLGKALKGDDIVGLTRGFFYAGSSNIVASLWEVDDEATSILMKIFYGNLKKGLPKKAALRQAQNALQKTHPQPLFWAAFYLTGNGI